ncbi:DUF6933 domain-containing protein [Alkalibacterium sp. s-m-28]
MDTLIKEKKMRIHCTKKMLKAIKNSDGNFGDSKVTIDMDYDHAIDSDELYDWHANVVELTRATVLVVLMNDKTYYPIVCGPIRLSKINRFLADFQSNLLQLMQETKIPERIREDYVNNCKNVTFTKTLNHSKVSQLSSIGSDALHYVYYEDLNIKDIDPISISVWLSDIYRTKDGVFQKPIDLWLEEW